MYPLGISIVVTEKNAQVRPKRRQHGELATGQRWRRFDACAQLQQAFCAMYMCRVTFRFAQNKFMLNKHKTRFPPLHEFPWGGGTSAPPNPNYNVEHFPY